ncbi:MAG: hypothetical protein KF846_15330 [Cyclobacteriaceae bacterium]|nr:hypothetical protein [Cyclobacteriaceae bacterium]
MTYAIVLISSILLLTVYFLYRLKKIQRTKAELNRTLEEAQKIIANAMARNKQLEASLQHQLKSNEELFKTERKRIATDLHDDIIQRMVVVRFRIEQLLYYPIHKRAEDEVKLLHRDLESIIGDIRYLIDDLVQPKFELQTFTELVKSLVDRLARVLHRKVEFNVQYEDDEFHLAPHIKRELYYIIQEAAQNSLNHSVAFILLISLSWENGLSVIIEDDGQGLLQRGRGEGYGTVSIQQRAVAIGADLSIKSTSRGLVILLEYKNSQ